MKRLLWTFPDLMKTPFTDDDADDASNMNNNMHGLKKDVKVVMITNMIPFFAMCLFNNIHNTSLTADTSSKVTTKVMTSNDTIMETNSNGTNLLTPPQSKTHHSDHSHHHHSSHHHDHGHRPTTLSKNKSKGPSRLISMSVLKSMLQKAVRRKIVMKAIRLTRYCMKEIHQLQIDADKHHTHQQHNHHHHDHHHSQGDERSEEQRSEGSASLIDLLRRIPIICLEDSLLHPSYPIIIWLMISCSHGYIPHRCLLDICVLFMHDISICNYRDSSVASLYVHSGKPCRSSSSGHDKHFIKTSQAKHWMDISNPTIRTLLVKIAMRGQLIHPMNHIYWRSISIYLSDETSILVAGSYGGMTGDMHMID